MTGAPAAAVAKSTPHTDDAPVGASAGKIMLWLTAWFGRDDRAGLLDCPLRNDGYLVRVRWRRPGSKTAPSVIYLVAFARPIPHQGRFLEAASAILISLTRVKVLSGRAGSG